MGDTKLESSIKDRRRALRRSLGGQLLRTRLEAGLSIGDVGRAVDLDPSHLSRVESGDRDLSIASLVAVAAVLGHDASIRLFPSSGPRVRDHIQVRMIEALLAVADPRWEARLEVPVYDPVHGVIDVVLRDRLTSDVVAGEAHSGLHSVDAQIRWAVQKADALPSAAGWPWADVREQPVVGRLLLLRSTTATRDLVRSLPETFRAAYPSRTEHAWAALTSAEARWPGAAILWVEVRGRDTRLLRGWPRGVEPAGRR